MLQQSWFFSLTCIEHFHFQMDLIKILAEKLDSNVTTHTKRHENIFKVHQNHNETKQEMLHLYIWFHYKLFVVSLTVWIIEDPLCKSHVFVNLFLFICCSTVLSLKYIFLVFFSHFCFRNGTTRGNKILILEFMYECFFYFILVGGLPSKRGDREAWMWTFLPYSMHKAVARAEKYVPYLQNSCSN